MVFFVVHRVFVDWPPEREKCQFLPWRCSVAGASGCEPHQDNDFVVSISNPIATRRTQQEDARCPFVAVERNASGVGPEIRGTAFLLLEQALPIAAFGRVPGEASFSRQNGSRCEHVDADGQNSALAIFQLSRSFCDQHRCKSCDGFVDVAVGEAVNVNVRLECDG